LVVLGQSDFSLKRNSMEGYTYYIEKETRKYSPTETNLHITCF